MAPKKSGWKETYLARQGRRQRAPAPAGAKQRCCSAPVVAPWQTAVNPGREEPGSALLCCERGRAHQQLVLMAPQNSLIRSSPPVFPSSFNTNGWDLPQVPSDGSLPPTWLLDRHKSSLHRWRCDSLSLGYLAGPQLRSRQDLIWLQRILYCTITYVPCRIYVCGIRSTHSLGETHPLGRWKRSKSFWQEGIVAYESTSHLPIHIKNMYVTYIWLIRYYGVLLLVFTFGHVMILFISSVLCVCIPRCMCVVCMLVSR
jgi:hypothetical protein